MPADEGEKANAPLIGFLAARFDDAYQNAVWRGAAEEAERLGAALVFFGGQRIGSPVGYEALDNIAFDLAGHSKMAGLIVMSNVIGTYISNEELHSFVERFGGTKLLSIGIDFPSVQSVCVDASGGMRYVAEHLFRVHGRRRFLFLAGPKGHSESEARKEEFMGSLSSLGRNEAPGADCVELLYGDFTEEDANAKVARFLDSGAAIDAVVAANDRMAVGAMRALAAKGIDVPREVSVTGFDDTEDSRFAVPPLTTVHQPAVELGRMALRRIAARMGLAPETPDGGGPRVSFVIRQSCGCPDSVEQDESANKSGTEASPGLEPVAFSALSTLVNAEIRAGRNPASLRRRSLSSTIREAALLVISEGECRFLASQRLAAEQRAAVLGDIESSLVSSFGIEDILKEIAKGARKLGMSGCWLSLFESKAPSHEWSRLLLAADARGTRILAPFGKRFRTTELVPGGLPGSWSAYVCEPLRFGGDRLGYLICTADSADRRLYEALRDQVSSALKGAMLMAAERDHERSLERSVRERTMELSAANARLIEEMERRKGLEQELLEISNLIMGKIGQDIHDNLCQDIAGLGIMAAVLEGRLRRANKPEEAEAAANLARVAGETAARAKGMARGLYPAELEARGLVPAVERLIDAARERTQAELRLEVTEGFVVCASEKALQLYRIVQEALSNAVRHSLAKAIKVGLYMDRETITVEVSDDGTGMPSPSREENGMGLHILKYRASVLGGELRIRSQERGTIVTCRVAR